MTYPLFSFTSTQGNQQDPSAQAGLNQYIQQGQSQINPGQAQVAQSNPISAGGQMQLAQALAKAGQQAPQGVDPAQAALTNGSQMQPNVNGQNMGGVGPTVNNSMSMQGYQGMQTNGQPSYMQQLGNFLSGGNNGG